MSVLNPRDRRNLSFKLQIARSVRFPPLPPPPPILTLNALIGAVGVAIERFKYSHAPLRVATTRMERGRQGEGEGEWQKFRHRIVCRFLLLLLHFFSLIFRPFFVRFFGLARLVRLQFLCIFMRATQKSRKAQTRSSSRCRSIAHRNVEVKKSSGRGQGVGGRGQGGPLTDQEFRQQQQTIK